MTPQTEAGKRLLEREDLNERAFPIITPRLIVAIEAEARRAALMEARAAINDLDTPGRLWALGALDREQMEAAIDALMDPEPDAR